MRYINPRFTYLLTNFYVKKFRMFTGCNARQNGNFQTRAFNTITDYNSNFIVFCTPKMKYDVAIANIKINHFSL